MKPFGVVTDPSGLRVQPSWSPEQVQGREHLLAQLGALVEDRLHRVGRRIGEAGQVVVTLNRKHVVQQEHDVFDGGLVDRHSDLSQIGADAASSRNGSTPAKQIVHI